MISLDISFQEKFCALFLSLFLKGENDLLLVKLKLTVDNFILALFSLKE